MPGKQGEKKRGTTEEKRRRSARKKKGCRRRGKIKPLSNACSKRLVKKVEGGHTSTRERKRKGTTGAEKEAEVDEERNLSLKQS